MYTLDGGGSLGSIVVGILLAAAAVAEAFGPELLHGVQRRRRETVPVVEQPASTPVVERKSAAL